MEEETITISKEYFKELVDSQVWLDALKNAGVDNWSGYDYAIELLGEASEYESEEDIYGDPAEQ